MEALASSSFDERVHQVLFRGSFIPISLVFLVYFRKFHSFLIFLVVLENSSHDRIIAANPRIRFPSQRNSKLKPRAEGPFQVLERINDNAYKLELPPSYGVHDTFNVADLKPYISQDEEDYPGSDSWSNPFEGGEDDVNPPHHVSNNEYKEDVPELVPRLTRAKARELQRLLKEGITSSNGHPPLKQGPFFLLKAKAESPTSQD